MSDPFTPYKKKVLEHFWNVSKWAIPHFFDDRPCIAAGRVAFDVLREFRVKVRPFSVKMHVYNPVMTERILAGQRCDTEEQYREWEAAGCVQANVGFGEPQPGCWAGHLVVIVEGQLMFDLTLTQATRPHWGIQMEPLAALVEPGFLAGTENHVEVVNGCGVKYMPYPEDKSYERAPSWNLKDRTARCTDEVKYRIRRALKGKP